MADRYWVGGSGTWNSSDTTHWSASSGGAGGASVPTSADNAIFDANSNTTGYTVTVSGTINCADLNFAAAPSVSGTIGFSAGGQLLNVYGSLTLLAGMSWTHTGALVFRATSGVRQITTNGVIVSGTSVTFNGVGGTWQLQDGYTSSSPSNGIAFALTNGTFDPNGQLVTLLGTAVTLQGNLSFAGLTRTGPALKTATLSLTNNISVSGTFTVSGDSTVNRILIQSSVVGTARTITAAAVSLTNADFMDIAGAGAATWSGTSLGDAGGNSGITFTTPVTRYWVATSGGNWSATSSWSTASGGASGASVPLCHDTVVFDANSITSSGRTITIDMPRLGKDITFAGILNSPLTQINPVGTVLIYGSLTLDAGMSSPSFIQGAVTFASRAAATITTNGVQLQSSSSTSFQGPGGTFDLADDLTTAGSSTGSGMAWLAGTFNSNGHTMRSVGRYVVTGGTVNLGASLIETSASGVVWQYISGVLDAGTSTLKFTDASATAKTFAGAGKTYHNVWFNNAGAGTFDITGSNTFNQLKVDAGRTVRFTAATTTTAADFDFGAGCTIQSITSAAHTLAKTGGGSVLVSGATISYSTATPASTFFAESSTNGGNNSGWTFGPRIVAQPGTVTLTGQSANVAFNRAIVGLPGAIAVTGGEARFVWAGVLDGRYRFRVPARTQRFTVPARTIRFRSGGS